MNSATKDNFRIPVLDISSPAVEPARQLVNAAEKYGFIFIRNQYGEMQSSDIDSMFQLSELFFKSPLEEKQRYAITPNNRGWSAMHSEKLDPQYQQRGDFKECFNVGSFQGGKASQPLPGVLAENEVELGRFSDACQELCMKILRLFALGLEIDPEAGGADWFSSRHNPEGGSTDSILRLLHYPAIRSDHRYDPENDLRAGAHSDYGSITLLFQRANQPGLEVLSPWNTWQPVPVHPAGTETDASPPILINIGDLLSYWTNGLLKSTVHRVVTPTSTHGADKPAELQELDDGDGPPEVKDRYSMAYFCHPVASTLLEPVPSKRVLAGERSSGERRQERLLTAAEHLRQRLDATYTYR